MTSRRGFLAALVALPLGVKAITADDRPPLPARDRNPNLVVAATQSVVPGTGLTATEAGLATPALKGEKVFGHAIEDAGIDCYGRWMILVRLL